jgi:hypothetical protein
LTQQAELEAALDLFLYWLRDTLSLGLKREGPAGDFARATDGETKLTAAIRSLIPGDDAKWEHIRSLLESLIADDLPARIALWCPAGASLASDEPAVSEFAALVREAAIRLGPHERAHVGFPIRLVLRKNSDAGNVVSVTGGLNPHWARFTDRVRGQYDLDSTQLHRLPEADSHLESLLDEIVERTKALEVGQYATIETTDSWTVQRLSGDQGVTIIGVPPEAAAEGGLAVRRNLRRILVHAAPLRDVAGPIRALVLLGYYPRIEMEGATVAMRGFEPSLYSGIDYVVLVADGIVKPLIEPAR